eukprot:2941007-Prymnesium_polylepis.1
MVRIDVMLNVAMVCSRFSGWLRVSTGDPVRSEASPGGRYAHNQSAREMWPRSGPALGRPPRDSRRPECRGGPDPQMHRALLGWAASA